MIKRGLMNSMTKHKTIVFIVLSLFLAAIPGSAAVTQDLTFTSYEVKGSTSQSSYPSNAMRYLYEGSLGFGSGTDGSLYGNIFYRATDDRTVNLKDFSFGNIFLGYKKGALDIGAGDNFVQLSDLSMNTALKGVKAEYGGPEKYKIIVAGGASAANWEELWESRKTDTPMNTNVWGARYQMPFLDNALQAGVNYGSASDDRSSFNESNTYKDRQVGSADVSYSFRDFLSVKGEFARSVRRVYADASGSSSAEEDSSMKVGARFSDTSKKYNLSCDFSRSGPYFEAAGGFPAQDLETLQMNNLFALAEWVSFSNYFFITRDNLRGQKETTSHRLNPGFNLLWKLPLNIEASCGFDSNKDFTENKSADSKTDTANAGLSRAFGFMAAYLNVSRSHTEDYLSADNEREGDIASGNLNGSVSVLGAPVMWNIGGQASYEYRIRSGERDVVLSQTCGLGAPVPGGAALNAQATLTDGDYNADSGDSRKVQYDLSLAKNISGWLAASLNYLQADNYFNDGANNYFEKKIAGKLSCRF